MAVADTAARSSDAWSMSLFWVGILGIFVPIAGYLLFTDPSRRERISVIVILAVALYLVKVMNSPTGFTYHDEFLHWSTTIGILRFKHLFSPNSLLPVSPLYPGLETITGSFASMSGLSIFTSGLIVIGAARLLFVLSLFLVYERVTGSASIASISSVIYMTNPNFIFFDAQFAYESLALPLSIFAVYVLLSPAFHKGIVRSPASLLALITIAAVVVTHHVTSYALLVVLALWSLTPRAIVAAVRVREKSVFDPRWIRRWWARIDSRIPSAPTPVTKARAHGNHMLGWWVVGAMFLMIVGWITVVARPTVSYLEPTVLATGHEFIDLVIGGSQGRGLFQSFAGPEPPEWERLVSFAAVGIVLLGLPVGLIEVWRRYRNEPLVIVMAVAAMTYVALIPLHFTQSGLILANRSAEFVFIGVAVILALTISALQLQQVFPWRSLAILCLVVIVFVGMLSVGRPPWMRLPGPFLIEAEPRSIQPEGIDTAKWMKAVIGPGHRVLTDGTNRLLMATYGEQRPISGISDNLNTGEVFFAPTFGPHEQWLLDQVNAQYLIVDGRLADGLPLSGYYFDPGEPNGNQHLQPISRSALSKFDDVSSFSRVYDSGNIIVYQVGSQ